MRCPACDDDDNRVTGTNRKSTKIARYRTCRTCGHRWITVELPSDEVNRMRRAIEVVREFAAYSQDIKDFQVP